MCLKGTSKDGCTHTDVARRNSGWGGVEISGGFALNLFLFSHSLGFLNTVKIHLEGGV